MAYELIIHTPRYGAQYAPQACDADTLSLGWVPGMQYRATDTGTVDTVRGYTKDGQVVVHRNNGNEVRHTTALNPRVHVLVGGKPVLKRNPGLKKK